MYVKSGVACNGTMSIPSFMTIINLFRTFRKGILNTRLIIFQPRAYRSLKMWNTNKGEGNCVPMKHQTMKTY